MFKSFSNANDVAIPKIILALSAILFIFTVTSFPESAFAANNKYAGIVIDAKTGKTLYADRADVLRYPASLTKIMTLYIVFEELQAGRLNLESRLKISKYAANQPPSKIGIRVGHPITVRTAIRALVTKSANDVATAVAENISGSERAFAERMTRTARSIGMKDTTFRNAHGLPNSQQRTTARDMAKLGRAIQERFPKNYEFFSTRTFQFRGRTYNNHNRLLGRVSGVDGIKTGYINASGYNLVTSVKRDQRHIVAVVMGGRTGASRNNHMIDLINRYINKASTGSKRSFVLTTNQRQNGYIHDFDQIKTVTPKLKPNTPQLLAFASEEDNRSNLEVLLNKVSAPSIPQTDDPESSKVERHQEFVSLPTTNSKNSNKPSGPIPALKQSSHHYQEIVQVRAQSSNTLGSVSDSGINTPGTWRLQVAIVPSQENAVDLLNRAQNQVGGLIASYQSYTEPHTFRNGKRHYKAQFVGINSKSDVYSACSELKKAKFGCLVIKN